jgi:hypothetical protein
MKRKEHTQMLEAWERDLVAAEELNDHKAQELLKTASEAIALHEGIEEYKREIERMDEVVAEAERHCHEADARCARVTNAHATRVRIGAWPIDPLAMTARARSVEGSVRCEWDLEKIVFYADRPLTEAEYNAVVAAAIPAFDRT